MIRTATTTILLLFAILSTAAAETPATAPAGEDLQDEVIALRQRVAELDRRNDEREAPVFWLVLGFLGQALFGSRFVVQWIATERQKKSVVPVAFWYLSLAGTIVLLAYAIYLVDPVFIAGFSLNMVIYLRNLYFIHRRLPASEPAGK